jgi:hypothetical protein
MSLNQQAFANGNPHPKGLFRGLAQAPLRFQNLVAELVDNALAAGGSQRPEIRIDLSLHVNGGDLYVLRVMDSGTGISREKLSSDVFCLGAPPSKASHLNEHGFGLKNVLSKVEQLCSHSWTLKTRCSDALKAGIFLEVQRPLGFSMPIHERNVGDWPSYGAQGTGTILEFVLPMSYLQSAAFDRRGAYPKDPAKIMKYLREHLGVFYRGYLESGLRATALIQTSLQLGACDPVDPVSPEYSSRDTYQIPLEVGSTKCVIRGEIGLVDKNHPKTRDRLLYYRHAPESQGVDIRIGNRVVATRLLSEIWGVERHPSFNALAGEFVLDGSAGVFPPTLNNKTSLDFDSEVWHAIAESIKEKIPAEDLPHGGGKSENDLRNELFQHIRGLAKQAHIVEKEYDAGHGVFIDIYWNQGGPIDIYEIKKGKAEPKNLYQLMMYWDALVESGASPTHGYLVSDGHSSGTSAFLRLIQQRKDARGDAYNFELKNFSDHGIEP